MCSCYAHRNSSRSSGRGEANGGGAMPWILSSGVIGQGGGWRGGVDRGSLPCGARSIQFHCTLYIGASHPFVTALDSAVGSSTGTGAALALRLDDDSSYREVETDDVDPAVVEYSESSDCESSESSVAGTSHSPPSSLELRRSVI